MAKKKTVPCHFIDSYFCPFSNGHLRVYVVIRKSLSYYEQDILGIFIDETQAKSCISYDKALNERNCKYDIYCYKIGKLGGL